MSALATTPLAAEDSSTSRKNSSANESAIEPNKRGCTLPLRSAIILMVLINISSGVNNDDAIAQGTSDIRLLANGIQRDSSITIRNHIANYLDKIIGMCNTQASFMQRGFADPSDFDKTILFMRDQADLVKDGLYVHSYYNNNTMEQLSIGPILSNYTNISGFKGHTFLRKNLVLTAAPAYDPAAPLQYYVLYYAKNKTCANVCPVTNTAGRLNKYFYNDTTQSATNLLDIVKVNFEQTPTEYKAWTRAWWIKNQLAGGIHEQYPVVPDIARRSSSGNIWAGLRRIPRGSEVRQPLLFQQLLIGSPPAIKTIWNFPKSQYPLLNISAATIYDYSGRNLSSRFPDAQFSIEDYMFQVTSYYNTNYKWIIVSGAPKSDYLQGTENLQARLSSRYSQTQKTVIGIAVAIVVTMSIASAIFTEVFIAVPLRTMVATIEKVQITLAHFMTMLKVFANSLKQNKELTHPKKAGMMSSVSGGHPNVQTRLDSIERNDQNQHEYTGGQDKLALLLPVTPFRTAQERWKLAGCALYARR
ncbi:hypothetical protein M427DRAFT_504793 [Gonapodya prolifera JEL478]|uniref:Uncharacterized protein n=1 Tax=Gonapodya prolifera (strain JEL478) TaxID=1344416 RepID=A0A139ASV9_GONPJ|nr:hypothetical protein M427DRAFT_504793 [Gonapodya prolifera JEL478]|eukprot:KXS19821.1 hypothetical protein M427DRAFT_504793 [Gonapodya prolifera JEL478]